jgi:hypothetical protein
MPPPASRHLAPGATGLRIAAAAVVAVVVIAAVVSLARWGVRYVHALPAYRLSFAEITLVPEPPPWYRGGKAAFLAHVAERAGASPQEFSALDVDLARLRRIFSLYPWVKKVLRVERAGPNGVVVRLEYREPVGVEYLSDTAWGVVVDGDGVILPRDDLDHEAYGPLVKIRGTESAGPLVCLSGFSSPDEPRAGEFWSRRDPTTGVVVPDARVRSAARLAALVRAGMRGSQPLDPAPRYTVVHPWPGRGLYLQIGRNVMCRWDEPTPLPAEPADRPDASRWEQVREWVRSHPPRETDGTIYLAFTRQGLVRVPDDGAARTGSGK